MCVDILKVDMKFLDHLESSQRATYIMESIISMADKVGIGIIAEGVETERQVQLLNEIGCTHVQGFLYARPVPLDIFQTLLAAPPRQILSDGIV